MDNFFQKTIILAFLLVFGASCTIGQPQTDSSISLTEQSTATSPQDLTGLLEAIPTRTPAVTSLLIFHNQDLVLEKYFGANGPETRHEIYSCTKSFIATLIGIAIDKGYLSGVDHKVVNFFPDREFLNLTATKESMTLEDVLTMSTGLEWFEGDPAYMQLYYSPDWVKFMLDKPLVDSPGAKFNYCSGCSHLLSAILEDATGMSSLEFANQVLFEPMNISNVEWLIDSQGTPIGGWGLHITPQQMAKLGLLYLNDGAWDGAQLVSISWISASTTTHLQAEPNMGYGYQWWIRPSIDGYAALGRDGQMIAVIPKKQLVVVFTSDSGGSEDLFYLIENYLMPVFN